MKIRTLILFNLSVFSAWCCAQADPRVLSNRYEPVESLKVFKDSFIAAYNSGNRDFIKSMVLEEAMIQQDELKLKFLDVLLPPYFNTHKRILNLEDGSDDAKVKRLQNFPDSFDHLKDGVEAYTILRFVSPDYINDVIGFKTYYSFLVVKKNNKLFIGGFNDKSFKLFTN